MTCKQRRTMAMGAVPGVSRLFGWRRACVASGKHNSHRYPRWRFGLVNTYGNDRSMAARDAAMAPNLRPLAIRRPACPSPLVPLAAAWHGTQWTSPYYDIRPLNGSALQA
jgi:hypothetical protein